MKSEPKGFFKLYFVYWSTCCWMFSTKNHLQYSVWMFENSPILKFVVCCNTFSCGIWPFYFFRCFCCCWCCCCCSCCCYRCWSYSAADAALRYLQGEGIRTQDSATSDRCAANELHSSLLSFTHPWWATLTADEIYSPLMSYSHPLL